MKTNSRFFFGFVITIVVLIALWYFSHGGIKKPVTLSTVANFNECVRLGYPINESSPRECTLPDGRVFVEGN